MLRGCSDTAAEKTFPRRLTRRASERGGRAGLLVRSVFNAPSKDLGKRLSS